jgi:hypothetical protein
MHGGKSLVLFSLVGNCYRTANSRARTHIIYIGIVLTEKKKIIIILKKVEKSC